MVNTKESPRFLLIIFSKTMFSIFLGSSFVSLLLGYMPQPHVKHQQSETSKKMLQLVVGCTILATLQNMLNFVLLEQSCCGTFPLFTQYDARGRARYIDMINEEIDSDDACYKPIEAVIWGAPAKPYFPFLLQYSHDHGPVHALSWALTGDQLGMNLLKGTACSLAMVLAHAYRHDVKNINPNLLLKQLANYMLISELCFIPFVLFYGRDSLFVRMIAGQVISPLLMPLAACGVSIDILRKRV